MVLVLPVCLSGPEGLRWGRATGWDSGWASAGGTSVLGMLILPLLSLDSHDSSAGYGDCCAHFEDYETEAQLVSVL